MERWIGRVALVTGASAGIGAAVSEALVKHGMKVIGCARNVGRIKELSSKLSGEKGHLYAVKCDLTKEEDILSMFRFIREEHGAVDVCINNAGLSHDAPLLTGKTEHWRNMLEVNVLALAICTREAYATMKEKNVNDGHIIHINSMSGHRIEENCAYIHFYAATKFAVRALLEGLRNEIKATDTNIRVSECSPGTAVTEFTSRLLGEEAAEKLHSALIQPLSAEDVSSAIIYTLSAPPHVEVHDVLLRSTYQKS